MDINIGHGRQQFPVQAILQSGCGPAAIHGSKELINRGERSTFAINSLLGIPEWQDSSRMDASAFRYDGINTHSASSIRNFGPHESSILTQPFLLQDNLKRAVFQHDHLTNFCDVSSWFTTWKCSYRLPFYEEQQSANQMIRSTSSLPEPLQTDCARLYRGCNFLQPDIGSSGKQSHEIQSAGDFGKSKHLTSFRSRVLQISIESPPAFLSLSSPPYHLHILSSFNLFVIQFISP